MDVGDLDIRQALHIGKVELAIDGVAPVRGAVILDLVGIEKAKVARAERLEVVGVGLGRVAPSIDLAVERHHDATIVNVGFLEPPREVGR